MYFRGVVSASIPVTSVILATALFSSTATINAASAIIPCGNNSTHVGWIVQSSVASDELLSAENNERGCFYQTHDEAKAEMTLYLWKNIMAYDVPNAITLGYDVTDLSSSFAGIEAEVELEGDNYGIRSYSRNMQQNLGDRPTVDGLSDGILNQTLHYAILSKSLYPWTDVIPQSIYLEYVVPYAVVNEPRTDYRALLFDALKETLQNWERPTTTQTTNLRQTPLSYEESRNQIKAVVKLINTKLWSILGKDASSKPIKSQAGLTPRIYDPLSVISYGHSSCTGLAILLIAALRTVGIPARMAGTPAWNGREESGNHSWLEVYLPNNDKGETGGEWIFLEPSPGIAEGDEESANADDLDRNPCKRWFCKADRFDGSTKVFATRYTKMKGGNGDGTSSTFYRMAWAVGEESVAGVERTDYYTDVCGMC